MTVIYTTLGALLVVSATAVVAMSVALIREEWAERHSWWAGAENPPAPRRASEEIAAMNRPYIPRHAHRLLTDTQALPIVMVRQPYSVVRAHLRALEVASA